MAKNLAPSSLLPLTGYFLTRDSSVPPLFGAINISFSLTFYISRMIEGTQVAIRYKLNLDTRLLHSKEFIYVVISSGVSSLFLISSISFSLTLFGEYGFYFQSYEIYVISFWNNAPMFCEHYSYNLSENK